MSSTTRTNESPVSRQTRAARRCCLLFGLALLLCCSSARAQTPPPAAPAPTPAVPNASPCGKPQSRGRNLEDIGKCLKHFYDKLTAKDGFRAVFGSVAPGAGITGGVGYGERGGSEHQSAGGGPSVNWQHQFDASARVSVKKYWELDANLRLTRTTNKFPRCQDWQEQRPLKIDIYGQVRDMPRLDYFGLGPESREQDRAVYHYREGVVGADIATPTRLCWLDVGGAVEGVFPNIVNIANPTVRSVERVYTEATAPGITSQPAYLHLAAYALVHSRKEPEVRRVEYLFLYHVYQDLQDHLYSFRRFDADLRNKFPFGDKNDRGVRNNELRIRGRLSFSQTSAGQRVPFYLMETLGGSNIRGDDTLRGFRDYRFRDRDYVLLQTEYLRSLYGPIDFIAFYDTGKVSSGVSHFGDGRLRHTYGLGVVVVPRRLDNVLFRFYVALGSGEGSHTFFGSGASGRGDRLVR